MSRQPLIWREAKTIESKSFTCGHCGNPIASEKGYCSHWPGDPPTARAYLLICHKCHRPTFIDDDNRQVPGVAFGGTVADISDGTVSALYEESRKATGAGCYSLAVLGCRKLLMHIAVSKGAPPGGTFISYVEYLSSQNFVPPDAKPWVDHIRQKGNEANHEISVMKREDAEELLSFMEMLLKVIFEFPARIQKKYGPKK
jgi:hypothetical protein